MTRIETHAGMRDKSGKIAAKMLGGIACETGAAAADRTHSTPFILLDSSCLGATVTFGNPGCC